MDKKKKKDSDKAKVNEDLSGFDIKVNSFGSLEMDLPIEDINAFLDKNVDDKKLNKGKKTK